MKKPIIFIILVLLILIFSFECSFGGGGGGGGGGGDDEEPEPMSPPELTVLGSDIDFLYTMITAQPLIKSESNSAPLTAYSFTLTTTDGTPAIIAPVDIQGGNNTFSDTNSFNGDLVYSKKQSNSDLFMREMENQFLSSKVEQVSKRKSGIDFAPPAGPVVGTTWNNVYVYNGTTFVQINTTCRAVSANAYFFVDNRDTAAMAPFLAGYCTSFDAIYGVNQNKFGVENDTDGNGSVIIIFSRELTGGLLGYFYAIDKYPKSATHPESNEGDIFYMTTDAVYQGDVVNATLAHEFQHMIYFDEHYDRGVTSTFAWLNEALSQAAEYYNNYLVNHLDWIEGYLNNGWAGKSLTHWTIANYGYGALFIRYLIDQYGDAAIYNMCATNRVGITAVENATGTDFNTIFDNFTRALVLDEIPEFAGSPEYNFSSLNLQTIQPVPRTGLNYNALDTCTTGDSISGALFPYRIAFIYWTGDYGTMNISGGNMVCTVFRISH